MSLKTIYPIHIKRHGVGYACQSIIDSLYLSGVRVGLFCITCDRENSRSYLRLNFPPWASSFSYRFFSEKLQVAFVEWRFLRALKAGDLAYVWPGTSLGLLRSIRSRNCPIVLETINTHYATSKRIFDQEYARLSLPPVHGISNQHIEFDDEKLKLVDFVFCPSPLVAKSLCDANVPEKKIIRSSYGLGRKDLLELTEIPAHRKPSGTLTAVFVGRIGIRKGAHLLLKYWAESNVSGVLKLVGNIEPNARSLIEPYLKLDSVVHVPFTNDLQAVYRAADIFVFPSLEEGSPLVTYLALGAGLPVIASPMGAGGAIDDGIEGFVIDPHENDRWISTIRRLFADAELRKTLSRNSRDKADQFLWEVVAKGRVQALQARTGCALELC